MILDENKKWEETIFEIIKSIPSAKNKSFVLFYVGETNEKGFEYIKDIFSSTKEIKNICFTNVLNEINETQKIIVISRLGMVKRNLLKKQCSYIEEQ